jgi:hypothetical protein
MMRNKIQILVLIIGLFCKVDYTFSQDNKQNDTARFHIIEKGHISYMFVENSYAFSKKDSAIMLCENAIENNLAIIEEKVFNTDYRIQFINSDDEMEKYAGGRTYGGKVEPNNKIVYLRFTEKEIGPITHEIMHMVVVSAWNWPPKSSFWINEGLATFAANYCSGYNVEELYTYFLSQDMLFTMDSLTTNFYNNNDMIAYHQSAFIVQYLIKNYGIENLKKLWQVGFQDFDKIYGFSFSKLQSNIKVFLNNKYPIPPSIDWEIVGKGCEMTNLKERGK